jgi:hypothetical protein
LWLVARAGCAAFIEFDQQLAGQFKRSKELLQSFEHLAFSQTLVHRTQCRIRGLHVGNIDLRIDERWRRLRLRCAGCASRNDQRARDGASTEMHQ